jgi:nitrous oxidase accessory protein
LRKADAAKRALSLLLHFCHKISHKESYCNKFCGAIFALGVWEMIPKGKKACLFLILFLFIGFTRAEASEVSLQEMIDAAKEGETVQLPSGTYTEPITIDKAITVIGKGKVRIIANGNKPAITIKNKGASVKNIEVENPGSEYGVFITGSSHSVSRLTVKTGKIGIRLNKATKIKVSDSKVLGLSRAEEAGNGIDLYLSNENTIENNTIKGIRDGIYVEDSAKNEIIGNQVSESRYGLHFMFTEGNIVKNNTFINNHTGSMVMSSYNELYTDNILLENRKNVNSQGLYLYDVHDSLFKNNRINDNRIGIMIDNSFTNTITNNEVKGNALGIIFKQSQDNDITKNDFKVNVTTILTYGDGSKQNHLHENYWDNQQGLDANGDRLSDLEVVADPYFMEITDKNSAFQLFFQSPGMVLMEKLFKSEEKNLVKDASPAMAPNIQQEARTKLNMGLMYISILFILSSIIFYLMGRKKLQ